MFLGGFEISFHASHVVAKFVHVIGICFGRELLIDVRAQLVEFLAVGYRGNFVLLASRDQIRLSDIELVGYHLQVAL